MALSEAKLKELFGPFSYTEDPKRRGAIIIEPSWVRKNITHIETGLGRFACHRFVAYQVEMFIQEGEEERFITDIGGIWVARHILWNPRRALSGHAFGCDVDLNVDDGLDGPRGKVNYADNSYQPAGLISIGKRWGFEWGGAWRRARDGMHFSFTRLVYMQTGAKGSAVKELQARLNADGFRLALDGIFGPKTKGALEAWQKKHNLPAHGYADTATLRALITK